jgi:hypothetical protein
VRSSVLVPIRTIVGAGCEAEMPPMCAQAEFWFGIAASGYLASALAKVATHVDRLDAAVDDAESVLREACLRFPGRGIEECLSRSPVSPVSSYPLRTSRI